MIAEAKRGWVRHSWSGLVVSMLIASHAMAATADTHPRRAANATLETRRAPVLKGGGMKVVASKSRRQRVQLVASRTRLRNADGTALSDQNATAAYDPDAAGSAVSNATMTVDAGPVDAGPVGGGEVDAGNYVPAADAHSIGVAFQTGLASWYGGRAWNGHRTSDGGQFSDTELTAAHATLPMGSLVRVSLASSERSVVVRINDRPGTRKRIIDLSRAAAEKLGILSSGIAMVTLSPL